MEGRAKLLGRCLAGPRASIAVCRLLLAAGLLAVMLFASLPAQAQTPHIAIGEVTFSHQGPDNTREYIEIANLGDSPWNPNDHWIMRVADPDDVTQLFVRILGVDPVPPGGVLLVEWGRPIEGVDCTSKGNIFCTGRENFSVDELRPEMSLAVFAPTADNAEPTVAEGTMLAYYFQGNVDNIDRETHGYDKAVAGKLWKDGDAVPTADLLEWGAALRMAPGPYPSEHGRRAADYYVTLSGFPSLNSPNDRDFREVTPYAPPPNTMNRPGTPGRPNYLHPGQPIPGQLTAGIFTVYARAAVATLASNTPPSGIQVVVWDPNGTPASSLYANNTWGPWLRIEGAPAVDALTVLNNPQRATRTLIMKSRADGALLMSTAGGDREKGFGPAAPMGLKAGFAAAAAADPVTGNEHYVAVDAGNGTIMHAVNENGKLGAWQPIAGVTTNAPVAAQWVTDGATLHVVAWNGDQLVLNRLGADGKFGAWQNLGAVSGRPEGIAPVAVWNPQAKRLEVFAAAGSEVQHRRLELTGAGEAKVASELKIPITTDKEVAVAVNPDSGLVRLLARGGGPEPGLSPRVDGEPGGAQSGFVLESLFDGTAWSAPKRLGTGRLPGPSPATPLFSRPVGLLNLFDASTGRFQELLIGEDAQIYHNAPTQ
jgi:hypothetical protein